MGRCFSDEVEQALQYIYYDMRAGKGAEGLQILERRPPPGTVTRAVSWRGVCAGRDTCGTAIISRRMTGGPRSCTMSP